MAVLKSHCMISALASFNSHWYRLWLVLIAIGIGFGKSEKSLTSTMTNPLASAMVFCFCFCFFVFCFVLFFFLFVDWTATLEKCPDKLHFVLFFFVLFCFVCLFVFLRKKDVLGVFKGACIAPCLRTFRIWWAKFILSGPLLVLIFKDVWFFLGGGAGGLRIGLLRPT